MRLGPLAAMRVAAEIAGSKTSTRSATASAGRCSRPRSRTSRARKSKLVNTATFFAALVDFTEPGELMSFLSNEALAHIEERMNEQGVLSGRDMADTFNMLRANDLIWGVAVNRYLLGKDAPAFDLLYWNSDATRIPRATHSYYLREMYVENNLSKPDALEVDGVPIDLRRVQARHLLRRGARRSHRAVALGLRDDAAVRRRDDVPARRLGTHRRHHQPARQEEGGVVGAAAGRDQPAGARRVVRCRARSTRVRGGPTGSRGSRSARRTKWTRPAAPAARNTNRSPTRQGPTSSNAEGVVPRRNSQESHSVLSLPIYARTGGASCIHPAPGHPSRCWSQPCSSPSRRPSRPARTARPTPQAPASASRESA